MFASNNDHPPRGGDSSPSLWEIGYARFNEAPSLFTLLRESMRRYGELSGLSPEQADKVLTALAEPYEVLLADIDKHRVLAGRRSGLPIATLRLKAPPPGLRAWLESTAATGSANPDNYLFLTRFAVAEELRAQGLGRALLREAKSLAVARQARGLFLYTAAANRPLLNFYLSEGFSVMARSNERGYERVLLFAPLGTVKKACL